MGVSYSTYEVFAPTRPTSDNDSTETFAADVSEQALEPTTWTI